RAFQEGVEPRLWTLDLERVEVRAHGQADTLDADGELARGRAEVGGHRVAFAVAHHASGQPEAIGDGGPGDVPAYGGHGSTRSPGTTGLSPAHGQVLPSPS